MQLFRVEYANSNSFSIILVFVKPSSYLSLKLVIVSDQQQQIVFIYNFCGFIHLYLFNELVQSKIKGHKWATNSCRDELNVRNGSNIPKIQHSVGERIDYILLVLVVLLSKHSQVNISLLGKVHECVDVIMKNWLYRLSLMSKHSCFQSKKWLFELFHLCAVKSKFLP